MNLQKHIAVFLLLLFSFTFLPKETIHLFFAHHDNEDVELNCHINHFETKHEHCDVSKFVFSALSLTEPALFFVKAISCFEHVELVHSFFIHIFYYMYGLKAPPISIS